MVNWRPFTYIDTGADTSGVKYIDVPNNREYKVYSINVTYVQDSAMTYTGALAPAMQIVTSTDSHTSAAERILGTFSAIATMPADTTTQYVVYSPVPDPNPGDTSAGSAAWLTSYWNVQIPDIVISTEHRLKFTTVPSTGGNLYIDIEGLFGIRRPSP